MKSSWKHLSVYFILVTLVIISCRKDGSRSVTGTIGGLSPLAAVSHYLKDSLSAAAFDSLDFTHSAIDTYDSGQTYYIRVPSLGMALAKAFVLLRTDSLYRPLKAARFEVRVDSFASDVLPSAFGFFGSIRKSWLNGSEAYHSPVNRGYILALHPAKRVIPQDEPASTPVVELPEIIIYAPDPDDGYDLSLALILDDGSGSGSSSGYSSSSGGGGSASGSASSSNSYANSELKELQASNPAIDLSRFFDCFSNVPDNSATTYQASLLVKVPNPANPNVMWDPTQADGVGHTFIQLTKSNGTNTVTQIIGFYGVGGGYAVATALGMTVPSKMVDNSGHPYNAKLTASLSGSQFSYLLNELEVDANNSYNLSSYNCTTYALDAFNTVLPVSLDPPSMAIPGQEPGETPNGLFEEMQDLPGNIPNVSVSISNTPLTAGDSKGACD